MRNKRTISSLFFTSLSLSLAAPQAFAAGDTLTLDEYLSQVRRQNQGYEAAVETSEAAQKYSREGELLLAPTLNGSAQRSDDERETTNPSFQGTRTRATQYSLGVSKLTTFGLNANLHYDINHYEILGANSAFVPLSNFYDNRPVLEFTQSLWRNFFGAETRANQERIEGQALATSYNESYRAKQIMAQAESAYWRLSITRELVKVQRGTVERAQILRDWAGRQTRMQLADNADLLQAEAALKVRQLDLQLALDDVRSAELAFNTVRGQKDGVVNEQLQNVTSDAIAKIAPPKKDEFRDDVKAAREFQRVAEANAEMSLQHISPNLELFGNISLNGKDRYSSTSSSESLTTKHPWTVVGVRFSAPLDPGVTFAARAGHAREKEAASKNYERKVFEQDQEWADLELKLKEAKQRYELAQQIEAAQRQKLESERSRQRRGRTTTYQVILFEQDYAVAALSRLRVQGEVLSLLAQMKTFGGQL